MQRITFAGSYFSDDAMTWYGTILTDLEQPEPRLPFSTNWPAFVDELVAHFGVQDPERDASAQLEKLQMSDDSTVARYKLKFDLLAMKVDYNDAALADRFYRGLPQRIHAVHPVFHVSQLEPYPPDEFSGRVTEPPPPVEVDGMMEQEVERILDSKIDARYKRSPKLRYYVKWTGMEGTDEETTWEPATFLRHSADLVRDFHTLNPTRPGSFTMFEQTLADFPDS
ncbi:Chromo domain-containing protein [Mycena kentingensis (nom. inval.)]|nr:Chromo domain-containing protein [Mycena kentingensis (nom. inval.)]